MFRYADEALILFPHIDTYENKGEQYEALIRKATANIVTLLNKNRIEPMAFMSDEVANYVNPVGITWLQTMTNGDKKYILKNCIGIADRLGAKTYPALYKEALIKYPVKPNEVDVFTSISKRTQFVEKSIIKSSKIIFNIFTSGRAAYNVKPKANTGRILVNISNSTFIPATFMGDMEINAVELLGFDGACHPVTEWGSYLGN